MTYYIIAYVRLVSQSGDYYKDYCVYQQLLGRDGRDEEVTAQDWHSPDIHPTS